MQSPEIQSLGYSKAVETKTECNMNLEPSYRNKNLCLLDHTTGLAY